MATITVSPSGAGTATITGIQVEGISGGPPYTLGGTDSTHRIGRFSFRGTWYRLAATPNRGYAFQKFTWHEKRVTTIHETAASTRSSTTEADLNSAANPMVSPQPSSISDGSPLYTSSNFSFGGGVLCFDGSGTANRLASTDYYSLSSTVTLSAVKAVFVRRTDLQTVTLSVATNLPFAGHTWIDSDQTATSIEAELYPEETEQHTIHADRTVVSGGMSYVFSHWEDEDHQTVSSSADCTVTISGGRASFAFTAVYNVARTVYFDAVVAEGHASRVYVSPSSATTTTGTPVHVTLRATPQSGYRFIKWVCPNGEELTDADTTYDVFIGDADRYEFRAYFARHEVGGIICCPTSGAILYDDGTGGSGTVDVLTLFSGEWIHNYDTPAAGISADTRFATIVLHRDYTMQRFPDGSCNETWIFTLDITPKSGYSIDRYNTFGKLRTVTREPPSDVITTLTYASILGTFGTATGTDPDGGQTMKSALTNVTVAFSGQSAGGSGLPIYEDL